MANNITVAAEPRTLRGKNEARRLRATGSTPAVVYGVGKETFAVSVSPKEVSKILRSKTGHNTIFTLAVNGGENSDANGIAAVRPAKGDAWNRAS